MPVSRSHGFAFVHIPKTAGISILQTLEQATGYEALEFNARGLIDILCIHPKRRAILAAMNHLYPLHAFVDFPQQHLPALVLRELIGRRRWELLFSFAFIRNPWDIVASAYHYHKKVFSSPGAARFDPDKAALLERCKTFAHFVKLYPILEPCDPIGMIANERGQVIVDFVGRYENLVSDFATVCRSIGIQAPPVPHLNATEHLPYREYYTKETRGLVSRFFSRTIDMFGYEF